MFDFLQLLGGIILSVGYIPQIIKLIKTKSAADFNIKTFVMVWVGIFFMEIYAVDLAMGGSGLTHPWTGTSSYLVAR